MVSPQLGGFIADAAGSFTPVFLLSAALAVVGMFISLGLPRRYRPGFGAVPAADVVAAAVPEAAPEAAAAPQPTWRFVNMTFEVIRAGDTASD